MYDTLSDVKRANARIGHYFFSPDIMRFLRSIAYDHLYYGRYFVTSERDTLSNQPRRFTVRVANDDGSIDTVGDFQQFPTRNQAVRFIVDTFGSDDDRARVRN